MDKAANELDGKGANGQENSVKQITSGVIPAERKDLPERITWGKKADFLLSIIGFAVDLGNVWRFPTTCYENGGGAFLIPYLLMYFFGGLPLFYMELALGQYQGVGCISVWERICPMFKGLGFGICLGALYLGMYYNTVIAWAVYYLVNSFQCEVPWASCGNDWNTENCSTAVGNGTNLTSAAEEFFHRSVLQVHQSEGFGDVGSIRWEIALCLLAVFTIVYFALWKGIKSSGKAVWVTATLPYVVLLILFVRGVMLPGSMKGIEYYLFPKWAELKKTKVWTMAGTQIFFSLGPGFGVLMALSSYNKFHNNCCRDAVITSFINCLTSFIAGFVVFSVLGYMSQKYDTPIEKVAKSGPGLVFTVYPEAIATLAGSSFWAIIFFVMLITLGLDSTFGGLESLITGFCDEWPQLDKRHELFVLGVIITCFLGALSTATWGGYYVFHFLDTHGVSISILFIVFLESIAVCWFYGVSRFCDDLEEMQGSRPGYFWQICWAIVCPIFLFVLFVITIVDYESMSLLGNDYPPWASSVGWLVTCSSLCCIPTYIIYLFLVTPGSIKERLRALVTPTMVSPRALKEREVDV